MSRPPNSSTLQFFPLQLFNSLIFQLFNFNNRSVALGYGVAILLYALQHLHGACEVFALFCLGIGVWHLCCLTYRQYYGNRCSCLIQRTQTAAK